MCAFALPAGEENTWLGAFGENWFASLSAAAACEAARGHTDMRGTDYQLTDPNGEVIRVQVKATQSPIRTVDGFAFDLPVKTYDWLRKGSTLGYLILVVMHRDHPEWTTHYASGAAVRATGYWALLTGLEDTSNTTTVRVSLPAANMVTPEAICSLFTLSEEGVA